MHSANEILQTAESVRSRFGTGNPFQLAAMCGAEIMVCELGRLKGLYKIMLRNAFIALNAALQREEAAAVCAHELGHHILHRPYAASGFTDASIFSQIGRQEYEADLFAAELLISDKDLLTALQNGHSIFEAATLLECTPATLDMKTECLRLKQKIR